MKRNLLIIIVFTTTSFTCFSQTLAPRQLVPARGYYKSLLALSPEPKAGQDDIDNLKFPYDKVSAERRLSLKPYYLENVTLDDFKIPDPPANSSEQTRAELNYLLSLQQQRTDLDIKSCLYMAGVYYKATTTPTDSNYSTYRKNLFYIGRTIGTWFNPDNLPITADLMSKVWRDASYFIWGYKYKYLRVRPFVLDTDIDNLEETNWAAYPSGHAANSYINAFVYQELAPEFSDVFMKDAYDMAHSREIIGVHYPSDSESSRVLARQFVNQLFQNPKFLKDFAAAKTEWIEKGKERFEKPDVTIQGKQQKSCADKSTSQCAKTCE